MIRVEQVHQPPYQADDDDPADKDTEVWLADEFGDTGRLHKILDIYDDDARARILNHLVAYYGLGEIYRCEVLKQ